MFLVFISFSSFFLWDYLTFKYLSVDPISNNFDYSISNDNYLIAKTT